MRKASKTFIGSILVRAILLLVVLCSIGCSTTKTMVLLVDDEGFLYCIDRLNRVARVTRIDTLAKNVRYVRDCGDTVTVNYYHVQYR